jgi:NADH dehydrogenase [ubiquinone] 1 alpha subcomplex assembly factor 5
MINPIIFDKKLLRVIETRLENQKENFILPHLQHRLLERKNFFQRSFNKILSHGFDKKILDDYFKDSKITTFERVDKKNTCIVGDEEILPFKPHSFDLVISFLQWGLTNDLLKTFSDTFQILNEKGVLMVNFLSGKSLWQLKSTFSNVKADSCKFAPSFCPLIQSESLLSLIQKTKYSLPTVDVDKIDLQFKSFDQLLKSVQKYFGSNVTFVRNKKPLGKFFLKECEKFYEKNFATNDGLPLSLEIVYGFGIKITK